MNPIPSLSSPGAGARRVFLTAIALLAIATVATAGNGVRERLPFNTGWRFQKGDPAGLTEKLDRASVQPWIAPTDAELSGYDAPKPARPAGDLGATIPSAQAAFDDSAWRTLDLPHDWGIEGPFAQENPGETGKLPWWGVAWYRKRFTLPAADAGKHIFLDVDGAMSHALVWCNGRFAGGWPYGYSSWRVDLTPFVRPGGENVIAIRLDNPKGSSRWYPGGGIYRNVWLVKTAPLHVAHWGLSVTTPVITADAATVEVRVILDNRTSAAANAGVSVQIYELGDDDRKLGGAVASAPPMAVQAAPGRQALAALSMSVARPKLWSTTAPRRYVAVASVLQDGNPVDTAEEPFGIRTAVFTGDRGFLLNGERVEIKGVCSHHDLGALGAALNLRALRRQLEILQSMGCNAIRTSHNPPAPELLDLCDRLGFLVMDEAFDCWLTGKRENDYHTLFTDWHEKDLRALVRRDRNHPSVVLWSFGNEIPEQGEPEGWKLAAHLAGIVREEDPTRPVGGGFDKINAAYNGFQTTVGVFGYNYKPAEYAKFHALNPALPLIGTETASCLSSRGEYFFPDPAAPDGHCADMQVSSYDLYAPYWGTLPDADFAALEQVPSASGGFVWTGFDYLGEPTPYNEDSPKPLNCTDPAERARQEKAVREGGLVSVPSRSSYFGAIDLAGFPKDRFYLYQSRWRPELPMAHLMPHWNWPGREGLATPVQLYTSGDEAELFLNGRSLGRKKLGPLEYRLRWDDVKYEPGEIRAVAYKQGRRWAEDTVRTTGPASRLLLSADRDVIAADGRDLSFVTVTIADRDGLLVPRSKNLVRFEISGPGEIVAVDNGDATSHESFQAPEHRAYNGLALVIVRAKPGASGPILLRARSDGLAGAELALTALPAAAQN